MVDTPSLPMRLRIIVGGGIRAQKHRTELMLRHLHYSFTGSAVPMTARTARTKYSTYVQTYGDLGTACIWYLYVIDSEYHPGAGH